MQHHQIPWFKVRRDLTRTNLIVKHVAGSRAYGTDLPNSDTDIRGVFIADPVHILTPFFPIKEVPIDDSEDAKLYELHHFFKLVVEQNPNISETLWVEWMDVTHSSPAYAYLRGQRSRVLSKRAVVKFAGYAKSEYEKMKRHSRWMNKPQPKEPPQQVDFVSLIHWFGEQKMLPRDFRLRDFGAPGWRIVPYAKGILGLQPTSNNARAFDTKGKLLCVVAHEDSPSQPPLALIKFNKLEFKKALEDHQHYWEWKRKRNPRRSALEEKYGYDTKNGMHCIRLLRTAKEILEEGIIRVRRPDARELLEILQGDWSYEKITAYAADLLETIQGPAYTNSELPEIVNPDIAAEILMYVQDMMWRTEP